ncbi:transporter substrate-binding domain-containing protein [Bosea sp. RAF48]|jgi:polar amino acid transport system substrate-binding protein|uniref:transporter substrate-binding domain-containing protein n=1 Tax=Bosea sp. RAF48 TaxID=3237480 RepID=UPI003F8E1707
MTGSLLRINGGLGRLLLAGSMLAAALTAAQADTLERIKSEGKLVVVTEMQFPPFDFMENGQYTGVNKDLLDEIGKEIGVKVEYVDLPWTSILPGLEAKRFDFVGAPVNATKERVKRYAFSTPFAYSGNAFIKKKGNTAVSKPEDLAGKPVGTIKASSSMKQLDAFSKTLPTPIDIREYSDTTQAFADVASGRLAAAATSTPNVAYAATKRPDALEVVNPGFGTPTYYCWVMRQGPEDASLTEAVNKALAKMVSDGRVAAIQMKWFGRTEQLPSTLPEPAL